MGETPESINDIQTSNSIEMEDTVMTDSMGPPLNRSISTPLYPLSNFRANNAGNNNRSSNNGNNSNNNSGTSTSGTSNNGSTNDSSYSDPMSVVGLTRQDDYSPHTQIPESPSTVALLHQVKAASISSSMNHVYKVHNNNSNNNNSNNNNNINTHTSHSNNTATTSSTNYTLSIGNSKDEIHLKNQDLDSLIKLAASMGQQIVIQQHNYIHHHHHHHHYNDGPSSSSRPHETNPVYYNRSASVASNNSSSSHMSSGTNHLTPTNSNNHGNVHPNTAPSNNNSSANNTNNSNTGGNGGRLSTNDVSNLSALFSELEELEVDGREHHHFGSFPPQSVHHPPQNSGMFKMEEENFGFEGIPFNPS